jgi:nucleoside-diphosphate-sugar epimerase
MKYLITGGAGFIGSHLCEELLGDGHEVTIIDDLSTGAAANVAHLREHPRFNCVFDTIFKNSLLAELVDDADAIVHLAAAVGVKLIVDDPVRTIETNVTGTELVLRAAAKKSKKVIVASTSEVYGKSSKVPFCEDDDVVLGPTSRSRWSYACSKAIDEFLALAYSRQCKTPVVVVRLFNTVGPRQTGRYGMVMPRLVRQALSNLPLTVYGDGSQSRCFAYVGDVVKAIAKLSQEPRAVGQVFNLGNNVELTIKGLAELVIEVVGSRSPIVYIAYEQAYGPGFEDMPRRVPSLDKIAALIGYKPTLGPREIIEQMVTYYRAEETRGSRKGFASHPVL